MGKSQEQRRKNIKRDVLEPIVKDCKRQQDHHYIFKGQHQIGQHYESFYECIFCGKKITI